MPKPNCKDRDPSEPFHWTPKPLAAVELLAGGELQVQEVADKVGVHPKTLQLWRAHPDFKAREQSLRQELFAAIKASGLANREVRIVKLQELAASLEAVIRERAKAAQDVEPALRVPGEMTGLLVVVNNKASRRGRLDGKLLGKLQDVHEQIAREMGHRQKLVDVTTSGKPFSSPKLYVISKEALERAKNR
jgi:hypothetical protein